MRLLISYHSDNIDKEREIYILNIVGDDMKKGFTLIELLAVIVLIGVLSVIGTISVTKLIKSSKEKTYQEQIKNIEISAKTWATNNTSLLSLTSDFQTYVSIEELKQAGLLENKDIVDPRTDKTMTGCVQITYNTETKKYKYKYSNKCGDKADYPTINIVYTGNDKNYIEVTQDAQDKKAEIINHMSINAFDKNGNVVDVEGPVITQKGEIVDTIIPNKVGDEYILTYVASQNNLKTTKSLKLKVVDTTPPEIYLSGINVTDRIVDYNIRTNDSFSEPTLIVKDNSGESLKAVKSGQINIQRVGEYKLVYTATDSSKNKSTYTVNVAVRARGQLSFSLAASEVTANNGWYKTDPTVTIKNLKIENVEGTPNIDKTTCKYSINSGSAVSLGTQRTFVVSKEGSSVKVKVDCSYNDGTYTYSDSQTVTLKIDKTKPTCTTSGGNSSWTNQNVTITGKCSDGISGCAGTNPSYTVTTSGTKTNIGPGSNGGTAVVSDKAGNQGTCAANQSVKIDKIAPTCKVTSSHSGWTNQNVTVTGTCSDTGGSGCTSYKPSETYSLATNSYKYPSLLTSNAYVKDNAGNKTDCGTTLVQIDKTRPYSPYICGVSGTYNISSISYACTCTSLSLIGGGGTYDKCNGRVDCKITIYKNQNNNGAEWKFKMCAYDAASGVDRFVWSHGGYDWEEKTSNHKLTLTSDSYFCSDWGASTLVFYSVYDNAGNTLDSSHYMTLATVNGRSSNSSCHANVEVTP